MYACVFRHFKLVLHRNTDVLSNAFRAVIVSDENKQKNIDTEEEFYSGFEECKSCVAITLLLLHGSWNGWLASVVVRGRLCINNLICKSNAVCSVLALLILMIVYGSVKSTIMELFLFCFCGVCFIVFISLILFVFIVCLLSLSFLAFWLPF